MGPGKILICGTRLFNVGLIQFSVWKKYPDVMLSAFSFQYNPWHEHASTQI